MDKVREAVGLEAVPDVLDVGGRDHDVDGAARADLGPEVHVGEGAEAVGGVHGRNLNAEDLSRKNGERMIKLSLVGRVS